MSELFYSYLEILKYFTFIDKRILSTPKDFSNVYTFLFSKILDFHI